MHIEIMNNNNRRYVNVIDADGEVLKPTKKLDMIARKIKNKTLEVVETDENGFPISVRFTVKKKRKGDESYEK